ncbi:MAG: glycosyltransferase family 39 protein [Deltaproteobacteria bacterium]|nr:glycosyltransferase family 39 protein [Deltaproteobacteria bacterium]
MGIGTGSDDASRRTLCRNVAYWTAVAVVFLLFLLACTHRLGNYWQIGHNGFNGAAFSNGARNTLRFGVVGPALYYTGLKPPTSNEVFIHHPMLLHLHLVAVQAVFGPSEVASRLVPATYSLATLILLFFAVRRLWGDLMALLSAAFFVLIPMHTIFANMVDHEQAGMFWCLLLVYSYIRWLQTSRKIWFASTLISVTLAVQFVWPGYYIAFFLALHALVSALKRGFRPLWKPEFTWVSSFVLVVLLNFLGFFLWIHFQHGGLEDMWAAFRFRAAGYPGYLSLIFHRSMDLHGVVFLVLLVEWTRLTLKRTLEARVGLRDLLPSVFLAAQIIHSVVFKQAGYIHSYWTYWVGVALAIGGADALLTLSAWLNSIPRRRMSGPRMKAAVMAIVIVPIIGYQAVFAAQKFSWGVNSGHAMYFRPYHDGYPEAMWARHMQALYPRGDVSWLVHDSIRHRHIELFYYLDGPTQERSEIVIHPKDRTMAKHVLFIADVHRITNPDDIERLHQLSLKHDTRVWNRRFVAIDVAWHGPTPQSPRSEAWLLEKAPSSALWRWFVNPHRPPARWVVDPAADVPGRMLSSLPGLAREQVVGGVHGHEVRWSCPAGEALFSLRGSSEMRDGKPLVMRSLVPSCRQVKPAGPPPTTGPYCGEEPPSVERTVGCGPGEAAVGMFGNYGDLIDGIGLICAKMDASKEGAEILSDPHRTEQLGTAATGSPFEIMCPEGQVAAGYRGRWSARIVAAGIACAPLGEILASPGGGP